MFYNEYSNRIKNVVEKNQQRKQSISKGGAIGAISGMQSKIPMHLLKEQKEFSSRMHFNKADLLSLVTGVSLADSTLGVHPDFAHLKETDETENHYIVSVFVDIQGSTNLFRDYDKEDVFVITNTIQTAVIHTCITLGGHVQRLQGDGVFVYFGGRKMDKAAAVKTAMLASSFISYFVKNDLKNLFLRDGIEDIGTRIGVDFGDDDDVMWANFGVEHISELTTLSLHTSLAAKMQANASRNGVVAGQHIKERMPEAQDFFEIISEKDRYIFRDDKKKFWYTQYVFSWYSYLKKQPFIRTDADGNLTIATRELQEQERLLRLKQSAALLQSGNAFTDSTGNITSHSSGVKNQPHRFHNE